MAGPRIPDILPENPRRHRIGSTTGHQKENEKIGILTKNPGHQSLTAGRTKRRVIVEIPPPLQKKNSVKKTR